MLLNNGSLILLILLTGYNIFYTFQRRDRITKSVGMLIAVVLAFVASTAFGILFAQTFDFHLFASMAIAVLFAILAGFLTGKSFKLQSALNGALTGWLGAMIGTYLGTVLFATNRVILIVDTVFIVLMYLLQRLVEWQSNKEQGAGEAEKKPAKKSVHPIAKQSGYKATIILAICVFVLAATVILEQKNIKEGQLGQPQNQQAVYDEQNDLQIATIDVTATGFSPKNTEFKAGTMIKGIFNLKPNSGTGLKVTSTDLDISVDLKEGSNIVLMNNPQPGVYKFVLEPGNFIGTFTVK